MLKYATRPFFAYAAGEEKGEGKGVWQDTLPTP